MYPLLFVFWLFSLTRTLEKDIFSVPWAVFFYYLIYFGIRPSYALFGNAQIFELYRKIENSEIIYNSFLSFCFFSFFLIVYCYLRPSERRLIIKPFKPKGQTFLVGCMISLICLAAGFSLITVLGGARELIEAPAETIREIGELGLLGYGLWSVFNLIFIGITLMLIGSPTHLKSAVCIGVIGLVIAIVLGRRSAILVILTPYIFFFHNFRRRFSTAEGIWGAVALLFTFIIILFVRVSSQSNAPAGGLLSIFLLSAELFTFDMQLEILRSKNFVFGVDFLPKILTDNVFVYNSHNYHSIGERLVNQFNPSFNAGIPPSIYGTAILNFGEIGIFLGILLGTAFGLFNRVIHGMDQRLFFLIYPQFILLSFYTFRLGDIWLSFSAIGRPIMVAILVYFVVFVLGNRRAV